MMWSEKHRPKTVQQMVGNEDARLGALKWLTTWVSGSKPLLLIGPPGTGKTTLAHALAKQFDYDLVEMNASDTRNKNAIQARITPVLHNTIDLLGRKIMLFLDEVDGISGREDTAGLDTLTEIVKEPTVPMIMAANEKSAKMKDLAKACKTLEFRPLPPRLLMLFLDHVLDNEGTNLGPSDKISIIKNSRGDIRSMLNSAQTRVAGYATVSNADSADIDIAYAIDSYFNAGSLERAAQFIRNANGSYPDPRFGGSPEERRKDIMAALFSSIISSPIKNDDLAFLLDFLSKADMLVGRANKKREWRLLKYIGSIIAAGLYERSRRKGIKYSQYAMPWHIMGPIFARAQSTRKILGELAPALHASSSYAGSFVLPYFIMLLIDEKVDPLKFAVENFRNESVGESIAKEIEKVKRK